MAMVTTVLRSLLPGQTPTVADLGILAQVVGQQLAAHRAGLPLVPPAPEIPMQYRVWGLKFGSQSDQGLTSIPAIADLFQRDGIDGRLLILGESGVGKTHTLLAVAQQLVQRGGPVPVLIDGSAWAGEPLREWLAALLWRQYRVPRSTALVWIDTAQLTLLVDGFDHLGTAPKRKCAAALEALLRTNPNQTALLCCRRQVLESSGLTFEQFNGGVHIIPLAAQQVKDYVLGQNRPDLWPVIKGSKVLQQLARLPLNLNLLLATADLGEAPIGDRADLLQRYLAQGLADAPGDPALHRTRLTWLADRLRQRPRWFYLEDLDRLWLPPAQQLLYRLLVGLAIALVVGLGGGNLLLGLALGLLVSQIDLESFPYLRLGLAIAPLGQLGGLALGCGLAALALGLGLGTLAGLLLTPLGQGLAAFGTAGALGALVGWSLALLGLLHGGGATPPQGRRQPNQDIGLGLRNSALLTAVLGLTMALLLVMPAVVSGQPTLTLLPLPRLRMGAAVLVGVTLWLSFAVQHGVVRLLLAQSQGLPPAAQGWLETMVAVGLLRRSGGGYCFSHEALRQELGADGGKP
jgi:hypothetical protein